MAGLGGMSHPGPSSSLSGVVVASGSGGGGPTATTRVGEPMRAHTRRIQELVAAVAGPDERLDPEVEQLLLDLADDFVEDVCHFSAMLAKHRRSDTIEPRDLMMHLEKQWQIRIPGFALPESALSHVPTVGHGGVPSTLASVTNTHVRNIVSPAYGIGEAHRKRLALIAKAKQKEAKKSMARVQATAAATAAAATGGPATGVVPMDETSNSTATGSTVKANLAAPAKKRKRPTEE